MSNISNLFENLMTYNETNKESLKKVKPMTENDSTLLNLTVELPTDTEDITPEDVKVDVGVMTVDTDGTEGAGDPEVQDTEDNIDVPEDVTPEDEKEPPVEDEEEKPNKEEALALRKEAIRKKRLEAKELREAKKNDEKEDCTGKKDCECKACKSKKESRDFETAKANILKRANSKAECNDPDVKNEALMHLDTKSLNKLMTEFVRENYKNIDKISITKAILENRMLKFEGTITNKEGQTEKLLLTNRGFNASKLEGKRFVMDFKDVGNTFGVIKESLKQPFVFTCTLVEGVLKFEELKYSFKTMYESKVAEVYGQCAFKESKAPKKESTKPLNENAEQIKKFNEIVDKIKAAKSANDLTACKDEMDDANLGDTLLSAAQMVWDDVNSRMVGATKNK